MGGATLGCLDGWEVVGVDKQNCRRPLPLTPSADAPFSLRLPSSPPPPPRLSSARRCVGVVCSASSSSTSTSTPSSLATSGGDVIREFYAGINCGDLDAVRELIAEDCVYEDLVFAKPFVGRKEILDFFSKFSNIIGSDLQFVIDNISKDDPLCVGLTWHLEWRGKPFPFSKGCSFYRLLVSNGKRQIIYGRDSVEPAVKPGDATLVAISAVVSLLRRFPQLADRF